MLPRIQARIEVARASCCICPLTFHGKFVLQRLIGFNQFSRRSATSGSSCWPIRVCSLMVHFSLPIAPTSVLEQGTEFTTA